MENSFLYKTMKLVTQGKKKHLSLKLVACRLSFALHQICYKLGLKGKYCLAVKLGLQSNKFGWVPRISLFRAKQHVRTKANHNMVKGCLCLWQLKPSCVVHPLLCKLLCKPSLYHIPCKFKQGCLQLKI